MIVLAALGLLLAGAAPADTSLRVPGTTLRLGITDAVASARGFAAAEAGVRHGPCRFFGLPSEAALTFEEGRLARAGFTVDNALPYQIAYVQDQLAAMGYKRRCAKLVPRGGVCDWSGPVFVHLEVTGAKLAATVERPGASGPDAAGSPVPAPNPQQNAVEKALAILRGAAGGKATSGQPAAARADTTAPARPDSHTVPARPDTAAPIHRDTLPAPARMDTAAAAGHPPPRLELDRPGKDTLAVALPNRPSRYPPAKVEFEARCAYPEAARKAGLQGRVWVFALVDPSGRVVEAQIEHGNPVLNAAALECVRRWRFAPHSSPAPAGDVRVYYYVEVPLTFTLH